MVYIKSKDARQQLGVTDATLRHWASTGKINYIRVDDEGNRLYDVDKFIQDREKEQKSKKSYIYCRVSSYSQKDDLERQTKFLKDKYPEHEVIQDIGSGINFRRKGLNKILVNTMQGLVSEVVVAHRDRLCRIAWEHFDWLFKFNGVNLIVEDKQEYSPELEFTDDLFAVIHVFSSRHNGLRRKYTTKKVEKAESEEDNKVKKSV